jgi:hypothetical protein
MSLWPPALPKMTPELESRFNSLFDDFNSLLCRTVVSNSRRKSFGEDFAERFNSCLLFLRSDSANTYHSPETGRFFANIAHLAQLCQQTYFGTLFIPVEQNRAKFDNERCQIRRRMVLFFGGFRQPIDFTPPIAIPYRAQSVRFAQNEGL